LFDKFRLELRRALELLEYQEPTEIQNCVMPAIMEGKDLMASAETGAGKTVAFVLPTLEKLLQQSSNTTTSKRWGPRALVLTPTRELADQITDAIRQMAKFTKLTFGSVTGGVPYPAQERLLRKPLDFLVATPGRLIDHMKRGLVDFSRLETFILDEADRMLDMGFIKDIEKIFEQITTHPQILLFSATLEGSVQRIARRFLRDPVVVQLSVGIQANTLITQLVYQADDMPHKRALLMRLLTEVGVGQVLIFTATKRGTEQLADELSAQLTEHYSDRIFCLPLHGDMRQSKRTQTLGRVRRGLPILVATDVAARGLDVEGITHVINFDIPNSVADFVHRIGRTGRARKTGIAISLVEPRDWSQMLHIERSTGQAMERKTIEGLEPKYRMLKTGTRGGANARSNKRFQPHARANNHRSFGNVRNAAAPPMKKRTWGNAKPAHYNRRATEQV